MTNKRKSGPELRFTPPGPGSWARESVHMGRVMSVYMAEIFPATMMRGFRAGMAHYGTLLSHIEMAMVERFLYTQPRPVGAPPGAKGPPPKFIFKLLIRLHPEIRRRIRRSEVTFRDKLWRNDLDWWGNELRPSFVATGNALQAVEPESLSDADLIGHLDSCRDFLLETIEQHHRLSNASSLPLGDYLAHAREWTGLPVPELLAPLEGSTPDSAGAVAELNELGAALRDTADAASLLEGPDAAATLSALLARDDRLGAATRAYIAVVGYRLSTGYDLGDQYALETPDMLIKVIAGAAGNRDTGASAAEIAAKTAHVRDRVPADSQAEFDSLLTEARATNGLRDERIFLGDSWATGLTRRAILAAGKRLAAAGRIGAAEHLIDARHAEIIAILKGGGEPGADELGADELDERARYRIETSPDIAPAILGSRPAPPPPAEWLPPQAARMMRAFEAVITNMFDTPAKSLPDESETGDSQPKGPLIGMPASGGSYDGIARIVADPAHIDQVREGDILVARTTAPGYNVLLPLVGAVVTERGGLLSHAAVVAREFGLPCVVGCRGALSAIADGARIRVDGDSGEVSIL